MVIIQYSVLVVRSGYTGRKGILPEKTEWWDAGMAACLGWRADLHITQLMPVPLPLTISCSSKSRLGLPLWCQLTWAAGIMGNGKDGVRGRKDERERQKEGEGGNSNVSETPTMDLVCGFGVNCNLSSNTSSLLLQCRGPWHIIFLNYSSIGCLKGSSRPFFWFPATQLTCICQHATGDILA